MTDAVLLAGGGGYVGSHTAKVLALAGLVPIVVDTLVTGHAHNVRWGPLYQFDIGETDALTRLMIETRPVAVIHFAASSLVGAGERQPLRFYQNNVAGTLSLLKAMKSAGVHKLVFSSTCAVYGEAEPPIVETTPRRPVSVYGRSKAMIEQVIEDCARAEGLDAIVLRYFNACGADPDGEIGEEHEPETHLIPLAIRAAIDPAATIQIFGTDYPTPDGTCQRDYIHVRDLADAHVVAMRRLGETRGQIALNLGTGKPQSVRDVMNAIEHVTGRRPKATIGPRRPGDPAVLSADPTRARMLLGFEPAYSDLETIVSTAWRFHEPRWSGRVIAAELKAVAAARS